MCISYSNCVSFTFHYVSIKSKSGALTDMAGLNLHSTMYLLNPAAQHGLAPQDINLHSTMYLLNRATGARRTGVYIIYIPLCIY